MFRNTAAGHVMCLKGLIAARFRSPELLHLLRLSGCVSTIPSYIESTNSLMISIYGI